MKKIKQLFALIIIIASLVYAKQPIPLKVTGLASWYGKREAGKTMANGQKFDPKKMTCASRVYPFGTNLKVTYLKTNKSVNVVVTDRGPFIIGRIIDLSEAAATEIGMKHYGIGLVRIEKQ